MRTLLLTVLLTILTLTTSAEEITTGNLLPNGTGSASNLQSEDTTIPNVQSSCSSLHLLILHAQIQTGTTKK